ncbi:ycf49-like protein isoform X2 [Salvia hispanica]|uniref:ycf49-like protein isoform X2 n=1 Tax=Salvia hispanica TaxID=49212 RepID=UPI002009392C|nr:ycf49-like protein isoform X2 [Salvia hispanica]
MVMINCVSLPKQFPLPKLDSPLPPSKLEAKKVMFSRSVLIGAAGITIMSLAGPSSAAEFPILTEPSNALSLPTWAVHVSSVVEWATAMALVWQYGEKSGYQSWKGLSWGMILVALQAALTVIGNATMCIAAYRIYESSQERSKNS